jgi:divalent metal cation (Fe/Co/Zn/Cd) transporter
VACREAWSAIDIAMPASRAHLISSALRLSYFTIAWNGTVGGLALAVGIVTGSVALAALALGALLDSSASVVLVWRFRKERDDPEGAEAFERRAQILIVVAMLVVALYVGFEAIQALAHDAHADQSAVGIILAACSATVLPVLGWRKLRVAAALPSPALRADAVLTLAAAALAGITLAALVLTGYFDLWWSDPLAALVIAVALAAEAVRVTIRHRFG